MAPTKILGWVLFLVGLVVAGYGLAETLAPQRLPDWTPNPDEAGWAVLVVGGLVLLVGLVLIVRRAPIPMSPAPEPARKPSGERVEIKRTAMTFGEAGAEAEGPADARLEAVRQRIARLKVEYGLGRISAESYRRLQEELEQQEAELERLRFREEHA